MSAVISASSPAIDLAAVKTRQQAAWSAGNYAVASTAAQAYCEPRPTIFSSMARATPLAGSST